MSTILTLKKWKFWLCYGLFTNLHVNLLCSASLNSINALETMPDILFEFNWLSDIN